MVSGGGVRGRLGGVRIAEGSGGQGAYAVSGCRRAGVSVIGGPLRAARAVSSDGCSGHRGRRSLHTGSASPSRLRLPVSPTHRHGLPFARGAFRVSRAAVRSLPLAACSGDCGSPDRRNPPVSANGLIQTLPSYQAAPRKGGQGCPCFPRRHPVSRRPSAGSF